MRIIIAGSRSITDKKLIFKKLDHITEKLDKKKIVVLSGHAKKGVDRIGEEWGFARWVKAVEVYHPDYAKYTDKKIAPLMRNQEMVDANADVLIAFWDGHSSGTEDVIKRAKKKKLKVIIVRVKG